ncbi:sugar transferase [Mesorhizobium sp. WSM2239]|uniref:Sugar transferase n=2 Tax=unclassified Mesorhizobium TaxID=325217 RepID=A0AAU8DGX9_9HYPH
MTMDAFDNRPRHLVSWLGAPSPVAMQHQSPPSLDGSMPLHQGFSTVSQMAMAEVASDPDRPSPAGNAGAYLQRPLGGWSKRVADVLIAATALVLAAPVMLLVALLIKMTLGRPTVFSHTRVGLGGKPFNCYKFRSMVANSAEVLNQHLAKNPDAAREWEEFRKLRNDPRVTPLGQMLRKSSLDELPQLFNVLRGEMSCVGPRPIVQDELGRYGSHVGEYLQARPGLTGLWQVSGRSSTDYAERVSLDSHYVRNWSLWLDLVIMLRTVIAVMRFDRAS